MLRGLGQLSSQSRSSTLNLVRSTSYFKESNTVLHLESLAALQYNESMEVVKSLIANVNENVRDISPDGLVRVCKSLNVLFAWDSRSFLKLSEEVFSKRMFLDNEQVYSFIKSIDRYMYSVVPGSNEHKWVQHLVRSLLEPRLPTLAPNMAFGLLQMFARSSLPDMVHPSVVVALLQRTLPSGYAGDGVVVVFSEFERAEMVRYAASLARSVFVKLEGEITGKESESLVTGQTFSHLAFASSQDDECSVPANDLEETAANVRAKQELAAAVSLVQELAKSELTPGLDFRRQEVWKGDMHETACDLVSPSPLSAADVKAALSLLNLAVQLCENPAENAKISFKLLSLYSAVLTVDSAALAGRVLSLSNFASKTSQSGVYVPPAACEEALRSAMSTFQSVLSATVETAGDGKRMSRLLDKVDPLWCALLGGASLSLLASLATTEGVGAAAVLSRHGLRNLPVELGSVSLGDLAVLLETAHALHETTACYLLGRELSNRTSTFVNAARYELETEAPAFETPQFARKPPRTAEAVIRASSTVLAGPARAGAALLRNQDGWLDLLKDFLPGGKYENSPKIRPEIRETLYSAVHSVQLAAAARSDLSAMASSPPSTGAKAWFEGEMSNRPQIVTVADAIAYYSALPNEDSRVPGLPSWKIQRRGGKTVVVQGRPGGDPMWASEEMIGSKDSMWKL